MVERADKLRIMDHLKSAGLWEEAEEYREATRRRLRDEGKSKEEAVEAAWAAMAEKFLPLAGQATPAAARLAAASIPPPPLAPIDLDENYCEKDFARAFRDSVVWAAFERRRVMVPSGLGYTVDYSRASRKPPTAMAMGMVEYYVAYPEKLDRLYQRMLKLLGREEVEPTLASPPKTFHNPRAEAYLRSVGRKASSNPSIGVDWQGN
jgi:hypothetical protein